MINPLSYIAYAAGFATGNYLGILIEQRLSIGKVVIQIITGKDISDLRDYIKDMGYRFTEIEAKGLRGEVKVVFSILDRKQLPELLDSVKVKAPNAFYSIEDVKMIKEGEFPGSFRFLNALNPFSRMRPFNIVKKK